MTVMEIKLEEEELRLKEAASAHPPDAFAMAVSA